MKNELEKMYNERYINKVCDCFNECKSTDYDKNCSLICNRSARIGTRYESMKTRIVFIGKEDVSFHDKITEPSSFSAVTNQHYTGTKLLLAALLNYCKENEIKNYKSKSIHFNGEDKLHEEFALTNHYHCAFKKSKNNHGVKTSDLQWENCASLVRRELEILRPHIIVLQAGWSAKKSSKSQVRIDGIKYYFDPEKWTITEDNEVFGLYLAENTKKHEKCYVIGSYHPSFSKWNNDEYLLPLQKRIRKVKELISK